MRAYVLPDPRLAKLAGRFVWLDIDTEKPRNAGFVEKFPIDAWPTLLVIDAEREEVLVRWAGTATAQQIERLAIDGERALSAGRASRADAALARADRLLGERKHAEAAAAFREALEAGGPAWPGRERAAEAVVQSLGLGGESEACADAARSSFSSLSPASAARAVAQGLACALEVEEAGRRASSLAPLEPAAAKLLVARGVLADDRSWLFDELSAARSAQGDERGAKSIASRWLSFLEREAAAAKSPLARSAFDGQRIEAARRLGAPQRVLPALLASQRDLPNEFVPPTNLAVLYLELNRPAEALASAERALSLAQGPRRVRVLVLKAQAQLALGSTDAARETLERALAEGNALPESLRPRSYLRRAQQLLSTLGGA
jgi:tetratricopeptide (TPR) repeat protein